MGKGTSDSDSNADRSRYGSIPNSINLYSVNILNRFGKFLTKMNREMSTLSFYGMKLAG